MPWRFVIAWGVVAFVAVAVIEAFGGSLWVSAGVAVLALAAFAAVARWRAARARRARGLHT
jgi:Flp pilus assembly protein TadB